MRKIRKRIWKSKIRKRMLAALAAGIVVSGGMGGLCGQREGQKQGFVEKGAEFLEMDHPYVGAWWGWLYPEFCFQKMEKDTERKEVHFGFWVAQVMDWW